MPAIVRTPRVLQRSFTAMGTPWRGPRYRPARISASARPSARDRSVGHDRDVALEAPVHRRDSVEQLLREVYRQELPCRDELGHVRQTRVVQWALDLRDRRTRRASPARHRGDREYRGTGQE